MIQFAGSPALAEKIKDHSLHELVEAVFTAISEAKDVNDIYVLLPNKFIEDIWALRQIKINSGEFDSETFLSLEESFEEKCKKASSELEIEYYKSIEFLIASIEKVISASVKKHDEEMKSFDTDFNNFSKDVFKIISNLDVSSIVTLLAEAVSKKQANFFIVSLKADFALVAAIAYKRGYWKDETLKILTSFNIQISQIYGAMAIQLGIISRELDMSLIEEL